MEFQYTYTEDMTEKYISNRIISSNTLFYFMKSLKMKENGKELILFR